MVLTADTPTEEIHAELVKLWGVLQLCTVDTSKATMYRRMDPLLEALRDRATGEQPATG